MRALTGYGTRAAALAAALAILGAAAAASDSSTLRVSAPPGVLVSISAHQWYDEWTGADDGTNPKITEATFSTTDYYDEHEVNDGRLWVQAKSDADLNALASPPSDPFEVEVDVKMTNDEDLEKTDTVVFTTDYTRNATTPLPSDGEGTSGPDEEETSGGDEG